MKVICVSGTPGTGKTTLSKKLAKRLNFYYLDVNKLIVKNRLYEGYDKKRRTKIVDIAILNKFLIKEIKNFQKQNKKNGVIIDSHLSHYLPRKYVDLCIVAKCDIKELNKRLRNKKFSENKIKENLQSEIFDICYNESLERKHRVLVVDTAKSFNMNNLIRKLGDPNAISKS